jgi:hypothetical protein
MGVRIGPGIVSAEARPRNDDVDGDETGDRPTFVEGNDRTLIFKVSGLSGRSGNVKIDIYKVQSEGDEPPDDDPPGASQNVNFPPFDSNGDVVVEFAGEGPEMSEPHFTAHEDYHLGSGPDYAAGITITLNGSLQPTRGGRDGWFHYKTKKEKTLAEST